MGVWFLDRQRTLGEILVERDVLSGKNCDLLDAMVRESQARAGSPGRRVRACRPGGRIDPR